MNKIRGESAAPCLGGQLVAAMNSVDNKKFEVALKEQRSRWSSLTRLAALYLAACLSSPSLHCVQLEVVFFADIVLQGL